MAGRNRTNVVRSRMHDRELRRGRVSQFVNAYPERTSSCAMRRIWSTVCTRANISGWRRRLTRLRSNRVRCSDPRDHM